ncbi:hypothetical protein BC832DRAFT_517395, partial [Gaertneriomyces semiglobifer]
VASVPLIIFIDDASGNRSKKWNRHFNWFLQLAGLLYIYKETQQDYHTHFVCTSNRLEALEMGHAIVNDLD